MKCIYPDYDNSLLSLISSIENYYGIENKRKTLKNNIISYDYEKIMNVLNKYGLTESVRAEQISEDIFIEIFKSLEC